MTSSIAAIHAGCKQLGIDEDGRRAIYARVTGKPKLTLMSPAEKEAVVTELRRMGFRSIAKRPNGGVRLSGKYAGKLQALWIACWNLGIVENRDDSALEAFVKRQTGLDRERFLHHSEDARKVIEALKAMLARDGQVDWAPFRYEPDHLKAVGCRIARAQWKKLFGDSAGFWSQVQGICGAERPSEITDKQWIVVMNHFGDRIRAQKAGA